MEGNRLKAEVAQKIMGIKVVYPFAEGYPYYFREDKDGKMKWDIVPDYPGDILAAWQALEKLAELLMDEETGLSPSIYILRAKDGCYTLAVEADGKVEWGKHPYCDTAPKAICKAALLAKLEAE